MTFSSMARVAICSHSRMICSWEGFVARFDIGGRWLIVYERSSLAGGTASSAVLQARCSPISLAHDVDALGRQAVGGELAARGSEACRERRRVLWCCSAARHGGWSRTRASHDEGARPAQAARALRKPGGSWPRRRRASAGLVGEDGET